MTLLRKLQTMSNETLSFETVEQAEKRLAALTLEQSEKFCPILLRKCRKDCMSFYPGQVVENHSWPINTFKVFKPNCQNALVVGSITCEGCCNV